MTSPFQKWAKANAESHQFLLQLKHASLITFKMTANGSFHTKIKTPKIEFDRSYE
jgi:hypothetical protein